MACQALEPDAARAVQLTPARVSTTGIIATGASLIAAMVIETVAAVESPNVSVTLNVKLSTPLALAFGT